jgi:hypothetical protein
MSDQLINYATNIGANSEVLNWLKNIICSREKRGWPTPQDVIEHALDYLVSEAAPKRLRKMSYDQAIQGANKWMAAQKKKGRNLVDDSGDIETAHDFLDGTRIVKLLSKKAYQREGYYMSHCVGGYEPDKSTIYSYRDKNNEPHATFEVAKSGNEILQVKGKGNGSIHPRYINPILTFLKIIGLEVRPSEMKNLGYLSVVPDFEKILSQFIEPSGESPKIIALLGHKYLCIG